MTAKLLVVELRASEAKCDCGLQGIEGGEGMMRNLAIYAKVVGATLSYISFMAILLSSSRVV